LILELCPPSGLKAVPPPDKLAHFSKLVPSLNPDFVCPALLDCLEEGQPWIIRAKALCVMETTLYGGAQSNGHNPYRDFFYACQEEILPMAGHPRAAISGPAKRVLALLGVDGGSVVGGGGGGGSAGQPDGPVTAAPNLLDFDDEVPAASPVGPVNAVGLNGGVVVGGGGDDSLFGGMQLKSSATNGANSEPTSGVTFGPGMQVKSSASAQAPSLLDDFANGANTEAPSQSIFRPHEMATTGSMFDQMTLRTTQEDKKTDSEDAGDFSVPHASAVSGGSAFGFINSTSSKESSSAGAVATPFVSELGSLPASSAPAQPPAQSFDPLKSFSPNSSKKTMALSPEQMQAMAYQQMMMQQQQQIQLQRMMMMQQQQGMVFTPGVVGAMPVVPVGGVMPGMPPMASGGQHMASLFKQSAPSSAPQAKKDDKKFDFVKDAMHTAGKK
jgi:hypothetical protein